jgi:hypothetical protein
MLIESIHDEPSSEIEMHGLYRALLLSFVNTLCGILRETLSFLVLNAVVMWLPVVVNHGTEYSSPAQTTTRRSHSSNRFEKRYAGG